MAHFDFRLRCHFPPGVHINADVEELEVVRVADAAIRLRSGARGTPIKDHSRVALVGGPYSTASDARTAAECARRALLVWAVRNRVGIDLGGRRRGGAITKAGERWLEASIGHPVRYDVHGIDVYEHMDRQVFVGLNAELVVGKGGEAFVEELASGVMSPVPLSEKQELAGEILSTSYFDASDRSRFVTLITAVEALLEPQPRSVPAQDLVARMVLMVKESGIEEGNKAAMIGSLGWLRRESIGQAGRTLADRLLSGKTYDGQGPASFFAFCYDLRSSILHLGKAPAEIDFVRVCSSAHAFVSDLLVASFAEAG